MQRMSEQIHELIITIDMIENICFIYQLVVYFFSGGKNK